jgi:hypothetical protein
MRSFVPTLAVALACFAAPAAAKQSAGVAFDEGVAAFDAGDYATAAVRFQTAYQLTGSVDIAFNVAMAYDQLGDAAQAASWYRVYLEGAPEAEDRATVEARIAVLAGGGGEPTPGGTPPDVGAGPEEEPASPLAHRLRASLGWAFYPGGAKKAGVPPAPVDLDGFHIELGYQLPLWEGLVLDVAAGAAFPGAPTASVLSWNVWTVGAGLGYIWTSLPYVVLGVRGDVLFNAMVPNSGDAHFLLPVRVGFWTEFPILDWFALHLGGDLGLGAYLGRDDKVFGISGEVGVGATFTFGGVDSSPEPEPEPEPEPDHGRPILHGPGDELGPGWQ